MKPRHTANPWPEINTVWALWSPSKLGVVYYSGTTVYIHTFDNRAPDGNIHVMDGQMALDPGAALKTVGTSSVADEVLTLSAALGDVAPAAAFAFAFAFSIGLAAR